MIWYVMAVLVVVVLGVVAAVAAGAGGTMPEAFDDRIDSRVPREPLVEADVVAVRFPLALRGYRMEEVDRLLDILGAQLSEQQATIDELRAAAAPADTPEAHPDDKSPRHQAPGHDPQGL